MAGTTMSDLANLLFAELERLNDDEWMAEAGDDEIKRSKAITGLAREVNGLYSNALETAKLKDGMLADPKTLPRMLGGSV